MLNGLGCRRGQKVQKYPRGCRHLCNHRHRVHWIQVHHRARHQLAHSSHSSGPFVPTLTPSGKAERLKIVMAIVILGVVSAVSPMTFQCEQAYRGCPQIVMVIATWEAMVETESKMSAPKRPHQRSPTRCRHHRTRPDVCNLVHNSSTTPASELTRRTQLLHVVSRKMADSPEASGPFWSPRQFSCGYNDAQSYSDQ